MKRILCILSLVVIPMLCYADPNTNFKSNIAPTVGKSAVYNVGFSTLTFREGYFEDLFLSNETTEYLWLSPASAICTTTSTFTLNTSSDNGWYRQGLEGTTDYYVVPINISGHNVASKGYKILAVTVQWDVVTATAGVLNLDLFKVTQATSTNNGQTYSTTTVVNCSYGVSFDTLEERSALGVHTTSITVTTPAYATGESGANENTAYFLQLKYAACMNTGGNEKNTKVHFYGATVKYLHKYN